MHSKTSAFFTWKCLASMGLVLSVANAVLLPTPPMGWSTWMAFGMDLSADKILGNIAILESSGLKRKGYRMIQIDGGWMKMNRTSKWISRTNIPNRPRTLDRQGLPVLPHGHSPGCIVADPQKFPDGMKAFGAKLKARGFQFGMYTSGENTLCDPTPSLRGLYASPSRYKLRETDARCFADWNIDLLKIDSCYPPTQALSYSGQLMQAWHALLPKNVIIYNCRYGCLAAVNCKSIYQCPSKVNFVKNRQVPAYCAQTASIARVSVDMRAHWSNIMGGVLARIGRGKVSRPGFWSDPDYLVPHETLLTFRERRSQFSAWCIMSAPLFISVDLRKASHLTLGMLGNADAIRVNQYYHHDGGDLLRAHGVIYVFRKQLGPKEFAILALHVGSQFARNGPATDAAVTWSPGSLASLIPRGAAARTNPSRCAVKSIWQGNDGPHVLHGNTTFKIEARDCVFLLVSNCR